MTTWVPGRAYHSRRGRPTVLVLFELHTTVESTPDWGLRGAFFADVVDDPLVVIDVDCAGHEVLTVDNNTGYACNSRVDGLVVFIDDQLPKRHALIVEPSSELGSVDAGLDRHLDQDGSLRHRAVLDEVGIEQTPVIGRSFHRPESRCGLPGDSGGHRVRGRGVHARPRSSELRRRLKARRTLPTFRVLGERLQLPLLWLRSKQETSPLDRNPVALFLKQLIETHGPDKAPRSEIIGPNCERNRVAGHNSSLDVEPEEVPRKPTQRGQTPSVARG